MVAPVKGASVKAVQGQPGHATTSITLDTYGHLSPTSWMRSPAAKVLVSKGSPRD